MLESEYDVQFLCTHALDHLHYQKVTSHLDNHLEGQNFVALFTALH